MKKMPQFEITAELNSIISAVRSAIATRVQTDSALAKNFNDLKSAETELDNAKNALAERDADFALAIEAKEVSECEKAVKAAKLAVSSAGEKVEGFVRLGGALTTRVKNIDSQIENLRSQYGVELNSFAQNKISEFEAFLHEAVQPLIQALQIGQTLMRSIGNANLGACIYESTLPSPTNGNSPILDRGGVILDGAWRPLNTLIQPDSLASIDDALAPIRDIQTALAAYSPFNPTAPLPYVKKGYTINKGGRPAARDPAPMAKSAKPTTVIPQEINLSPALARASADQFDLDEQLQR
jgi:hypothetical protein